MQIKSLSLDRIILRGTNLNCTVQVVKDLQNLYEGLLHDFPLQPHIFLESIKARASYPQNNKGTELFMDAVELPDKGDEHFFKNLKRLHTTLSTRDPLLYVPKGLEARRRISFFSNSLFMTMPRAPQVFIGNQDHLSTVRFNR